MYPLNSFYIKYPATSKSDVIDFLKKQPGLLYNGCAYLVSVPFSIHYDALVKNDFTLYNLLNDGEHTQESFQHLFETFDLDKMAPIYAHRYTHSQCFWIQDGNHRASILYFLKYKNISQKLACIEYRSCVTDELKRILHSTIDGTHSNGWFNRTTFGYHSFKISNFEIIGQRKPHIRLEKIKKYYDFTNKRVLDFGCNNGGMLFHIPEIEAGLGIDFDTRCIDACHRIQKLLMFSTDYKFEQGDLNEIDIAKKCNEFKPDCVFLLSLGMWVKDWKHLYKSVYDNSKTIIFEQNHISDSDAFLQLDYFFKLGANIQMISSESNDDCTGNYFRKSYIIKSA